MAYENSNVAEMMAILAGTFAGSGYPAPAISVYDPAGRCSWLDLLCQPLDRRGGCSHSMAAGPTDS